LWLLSCNYLYGEGARGIVKSHFREQDCFSFHGLCNVMYRLQVQHLLTLRRTLWNRELWFYGTCCHLSSHSLFTIYVVFKCSTIAGLLTAYTECPRRSGQNFGIVFLMLNYTDITQNNYIQSWTVTEIMAIEKCGLLGCPRIVRRPWRHIRPVRKPGNQTPLANIVMQWPWRDNASAATCVNYLET